MKDISYVSFPLPHCRIKVLGRAEHKHEHSSYDLLTYYVGTDKQFSTPDRTRFDSSMNLTFRSSIPEL